MQIDESRMFNHSLIIHMHMHDYHSTLLPILAVQIIGYIIHHKKIGPKQWVIKEVRGDRYKVGQLARNIFPRIGPHQPDG